MASSSIDIEARTATSANGDNSVVAEYMWGVLSPLLTMVESLILEYPNTHHKVSSSCFFS